MIASLLPSWVAVADSVLDFGEDQLFPAERDLIARAVDKRRAEFTTVRACARQALAELGVPAVPILPGERGAPRWPDGVVGTMTHCAGYRAAAVAPAGRAASLGIDAEPHQPLPDGVLRLVAREEELPRLDELAAGWPDVHWDRLLFTMKESVYKAWFPLMRKWLDFDGASIRIDPGARRFTAELQVPGPVVDGRQLSAFDGRFSIGTSLVASAILVPAVQR